ncbi:hypothetical protein C3K47_06300 [Solitalea longa]|uniref:Bacteroidetes PKD-like domain-containing protein n=1 Tax=Solitalea longa TaxID=2079460 RepID=A0A2S5A459_9SPHI|nr:PKD-like family lipoprotein [Solitalea longa]POY37370.1 hypothetical protein C3K47_06300 [Solitalea longa]
MKRKYCFAALMALSLFWAGCAKDEGNYTYKNLSTYFVDTAGMPKSYLAKQNDVVNINLNNVEGASTDLSYEWKLVTQSYAADPNTGTYVNKTLATTKDLSFKVVDVPGEYYLVLYTKDNSNGGITQTIKKALTISGYASPGLMVVHGSNNESDISILVNSKLYSAYTQADKIQSNVFSEINGTKIPGDGAGVTHMVQGWVSVFTNNNSGGYRLNLNDLRIMNTYPNMFVMPMASGDVQFQAYDSWSYNELMINKGDLYFMSQAQVNIFNKYGYKCYGQDYVAAPFIAATDGGKSPFVFYGVIYDAKNRRFLYIDYNHDIKLFKSLPANGAGKFDMSNVGKDMVYAEMGLGTTTPKWYCVMQSPNNPATRQLYVCQFNVADDGNRGVDLIDISAATDLANSKYFAFGSKANIMYHATDTKIYQNNYASDKKSNLLLDISGSYPGSVITSMKIFKYTSSPVHPNDGKLLYVALYNATTNESTLLQINVSEINGSFGTITPYLFSGKISAMSYKAK